MKYANNEAYFDCIEDVDAIIDANGTVVSAEIHGNVSSPIAVWKDFLLTGAPYSYLLGLGGPIDFCVITLHLWILHIG